MHFNISRNKTLEKVIHSKKNDKVRFSIAFDRRIVNKNDRKKVLIHKMPLMGWHEIWGII